MTREPHGAMLSEEHFSASSKQRHPIVRNGPYPNDTQSLPWLNTHASLMLSLLLIGCAAGDPDISAQITAQFDATPSAPIDLRHIAGPDWERMCVLSPYTNNQRTAETLGFAWDAERISSIGTDDGIATLVFIHDNEVIAFTEHPRNKGDFVGIQPSCLERTRARFDRQSRNTWILLKPQH